MLSGCMKLIHCIKKSVSSLIELILKESVIFCQAKYIAGCLDEIKQELRQENATVKANAVAKLTYVSNKYNLITVNVKNRIRDTYWDTL